MSRRWPSLRERGVEGALGGEGPDVQLVDHRAGELAAGPARVVPLEVGGVVGAGEAVDAVGLAPRPAGRGAVSRRRRSGSRSRPPRRPGRGPGPVGVHQSSSSRTMSMVSPAATQAHPGGPGRPDVEGSVRHESSRTSRATGWVGEEIGQRSVARARRPAGQHVAPGAGRQVERGVTPAAGGEADRQPGRDGDRAAAVEGQHVVGGRPAAR